MLRLCLSFFARCTHTHGPCVYWLAVCIFIMKISRISVMYSVNGLGMSDHCSGEKLTLIAHTAAASAKFCILNEPKTSLDRRVLPIDKIFCYWTSTPRMHIHSQPTVGQNSKFIQTALAESVFEASLLKLVQFFTKSRLFKRSFNSILCIAQEGTRKTLQRNQRFLAAILQ